MLWQEPARHSWANFAICCVVQHYWLRELLLAIGFLDADSDGGLLYWRWDFWNANTPKMSWEWRHRGRSW